MTLSPELYRSWYQAGQFFAEHDPAMIDILLSRDYKPIVKEAIRSGMVKYREDAKKIEGYKSEARRKKRGLENGLFGERKVASWLSKSREEDESRSR